MKTLFKLLIAAVVLNACARVGMAALTYYEFKDAAHELIAFSLGASPSDLQDEIAKKGQELGVPIDPSNVSVERDDTGTRTTAAASYSQPVELFPGHVYPLALSFQTDVVALRPTTAKDALGQR